MMLATTKDESSCAHRMMWKGRNGYAVGFTRVLRGAIVGWGVMSFFDVVGTAEECPGVGVQGNDRGVSG